MHPVTSVKLTFPFEFSLSHHLRVVQVSNHRVQWRKRKQTAFLLPFPSVPESTSEIQAAPEKRLTGPSEWGIKGKKNYSNPISQSTGPYKTFSH